MVNNYFYLLCILVYFPISFFEHFLPALFKVFVVFYLTGVQVSIGTVTASSSFVVHGGSTGHVLIVVLHVHVSLGIPISSILEIIINLADKNVALRILWIKWIKF